MSAVIFRLWDNALREKGIKKSVILVRRIENWVARMLNLMML